MSAGVISKHRSRDGDRRILFDPDTVCIWWANLDWAGDRIASAWPGLSADERERANLYHRPIDRHRFVAARTCLRRILSSYLGVPPGAVTFELGQHGKPRLTSDFAEIHFNTAHSNELAVFAVAIGHELGVDLERVQPNIRCLEIARHFFAPEEQEVLENLAGEDRVRAFYRCWTRKEAYVKAIGAGLFLPLDSFVVSVLPDHSVRPSMFPPRRVDCVRCSALLPKSVQLASRCTLIDISPDRNFAAALAILDPRKTQTRTTQSYWT